MIWQNLGAFLINIRINLCRQYTLIHKLRLPITMLRQWHVCGSYIRRYGTESRITMTHIRSSAATISEPDTHTVARHLLVQILWATHERVVQSTYLEVRVFEIRLVI
jgi:hypothetical protein